MRKSATLATALAACGLAAAPAAADVVGPIDFEAPTYAPGSIDGQDGWSSSGPFDHEVVVNGPGAPGAFGDQSFRISNGVAAGSFGDQTFSRSLAEAAGESGAEGGTQSSAPQHSRFESQWSVASVTPGAEQPGLSVVASPDRGDGARMSWVSMEDKPAGLTIGFFDYVSGRADAGSGEGFGEKQIVAERLDRSVPHTVRITMDLLDGPGNDVVRVYVDDELRLTGTSWEDYFREQEGNPTRTVDSLLFRTSVAAPATLGAGFLIDALELESRGPLSCQEDRSGDQEQGPVSGAVHGVDSALPDPLGETVHHVNCDVVVSGLGL